MFQKKSRSTALQVAQQIAVQQGIDKTNARPAELVLVMPITTAKESYKFSLKHEDNSAYSIAKGLMDRNGFVATHMALGICKAPIINSNEYLGANAIQFWPDPFIFNTAATTDLSEARALEHIYSTGTYTLKTNQGNRIDEEKTRHFRTVQQTQGTATTANIEIGEELKELDAAVRFGGGDDNYVIVNFSCADKTDINGGATSNNYLVVILSGAIIHGATTKQYLG